MKAGPATIDEQHRDHAGQQHQLHGAIASTTASRPIERLALTSTASPGRIRSGSASAGLVDGRRTSGRRSRAPAARSRSPLDPELARPARRSRA